MISPARASIAGAVATLLYFGVAEFIATVLAPVLPTVSAPLLVLGQTIIPLTPTAVVEGVIAVFGTHDKLVLVITIVVIGALIGGLIGRLGANNRSMAFVLLAGFGLLPAVLLLTSASGLVGVVPTLLGAAVGLVCYWWLTRTGIDAAESVDAAGARSRRAFLGTSALLGAVGVAAIAAGRSASVLARNAAGAVTALVLPGPATSAKAIPTGAELPVSGLTPLVTPADDFYRIDTALIPPVVDPSSWSLRIHGMVEHEVTVTMEELLALPLEEHWITLTCVSNQVGGELVGNAKWLGFPIRELLDRAKPKAGSDMVLSRSQDGFTASSPLEALTDDRAALVAVGMNGAPLPRDHGFPVRLVVPGLYGFVSATKWVTELEVTRFADQEAYWTRRGWSSHGPILVSSRVDVPRAGSSIGVSDGGTVVTAGMAWAQHTGVAEVHARLDSGPWQKAELSEPLTVDTWRQWRCVFDGVEQGGHTVTVRATDADGNEQIAESRPPIPGSATGLHSRDFSVG